MKNTIDPEPLAQFVFVEFDENNPEDRDVYMFFNGYTVAYIIDRSNVDANGNLNDEAFQYYIKNSEGKTLKFKFEFYGGLKEINPKTDKYAKKLDWIRYEKEKFIDVDGAEQVTSFQLKESEGHYRVRKTVLAKEIDGDVLIEKPATQEEQETFNQIFSYLIEELYTFFELHKICSQAGGVTIVKDGHKKIDTVSKEVLIDAGIENQQQEQEFMKQYLENYKKEKGLENENISYLPNVIPLIQDPFLEKIMTDIDETGKDGEVYHYKKLNIKSGDYYGALNDAKTALNSAFKNILDEFDNPFKAMVTQGKIAKTHRFDQLLNMTVQQPFLQRYNPDNSKFQTLAPVRVSRHNAKNIVLNYVDIKTDDEMDYFEQLVYSAHKTWFKLYPNDPPTFLDIGNILHHPKNKKTLLSSRSKLIKDIEESYDKLMTSLCKIDFRGQAQAYKDSKEVQQYFNSGGRGVIKFPYVSGIVGPVKTANGEVLDGIIPDGEKADKILDAYIAMTGQVRTVTGDALINPLSATRLNLMIFHYLLSKVCSMPYSNNKVSLFSEKQRYLNLSKELEQETENNKLEEKPVKEKSSFDKKPEIDLEPELICLQEDIKVLSDTMTELESDLPKRNLTISLDTIIEDLKLNNPEDTPKQINRRRNTVKTQVEKVLKFWKSEGLINGATINLKPNGRGIQSYTIHFFEEIENEEQV